MHRDQKPSQALWRLSAIPLLLTLGLPGAGWALSPSQVDAARTAGTLKEIRLSGTSSIRITLAAFVQQLCQPGTLDVYFDAAASATARDGDRQRAYACTLGQASGSYAIGTPVVVYKADANDASDGLRPLATLSPIAFLKLSSDGSCAATGSSFQHIFAPQYRCSMTEPRVPDGGLLDASVGMLSGVPNLPDSIPGAPDSGPSAAVDNGPILRSSFTDGFESPLEFLQMIYGVAVNKRAYLALQKTQGLVPAGATLIDESPTAQPSLSSDFVRAAMLGGLSASPITKRGWGLEIDESVDPTVTTKAFNVCRFRPGAGVQALMNLALAQNAPTQITAASVLLRQATSSTPVHAAQGSYIIDEQAHHGGVETCLGTTIENIPGAYGVAVMAAENNPLAKGQDRGYRFVKLDGRSPRRYDTATRRGAATGHYGWVYPIYLLRNADTPGLDSGKNSFLTSLADTLPKPDRLAAADTDAQGGAISPSKAWASLGQYPALSEALRPYCSRVARSSGVEGVLRLVR